MNTHERHHQLTEQLLAAVQDHLAGAGEVALLKAYDVGRSAVADRLNALEMLALQQEALIRLLVQRIGDEEGAHLTQAAAEVFAESLASFELAVRSSQEGNALLRHLNVELERQVAERTAKLAESEERFRNTFEHAPIGIALVAPDGRWLDANHTLCEMLDYTEQELLTTTFQALTHPDDVATDLANGQRLLAGEVTSYQREKRYLCKDGRIVQTLVNVSLVRDAQGLPVYLIAQIQDVTERKRTEDALRESEERFRSFMNHSPMAAYIKDENGRYVYGNEQVTRLLTHSAPEWYGKTDHEIWPGETAQRLHANDMTVLIQGKTIEQEETTEHDDGVRHWLSVKFPLTIATEQRFVGGVSVDITQQVRSRKQLIERERLAAIGTTTAKLVHEIGNPLNGMSVAMQLLQRRLSKSDVDDHIRASVNALQGQVSRLSNLLQEFRSLSRQREFTFRPTNLVEVIGEVLTADLPLYAERGIAIEKVCEPELPAVRADGDKLKQVLLNLCKNAIEAMPDGGTLTVRSSLAGAQAIVEVADTGKGIPDDVDIFEPFVTTKAEGTGLGLAIVRQIVAAHDGTLTYRSARGQGTTFTVTLPLQSQEGRRGDA